MIFFKPKFEVYMVSKGARCCHRKFRRMEDADRYAEELWLVRHNIEENIILKSMDGRVYEVS